MIETVAIFGLVNIIFEMVLLAMMPVRMRLRVLGTPVLANLMHIGMLLGNLMVHWGTVVGTMSSVVAFIGSLVALKVAARLFGKLEGGRYYTLGLIKYSPEELK